MNRVLAASALVPTLLAACQSGSPMSRLYFEAAQKLCGFEATTYTPRDGFLLDEPLVDFSQGKDSRQAHDCFNRALEKLDRAATERGAIHISYIWEYKS